ncbi:hypothetical protein [uncultured Winogradskyella sp.]|uniref:hypothetical protein n=1 Tax=uncultured Winogradskyella sp. TaxID=395353 RepID=UPI002639B02E|nr:hypothetical protein [uncultured Winogradskyella sp.]
MIKFFRRIRQNLLSEGKTGKYFKYAIGEIILVIIGILLALQINNWNIKRLENIRADNFIEQMKSQVEGNILNVNENLQKYQSHLKVTEDLISIIGTENTKDIDRKIDSLVSVNIYDYHLNLNMNTLIEGRENGDLALIDSDSLRQSIYELNTMYKHVSERERIANQDLNDFFIPYLNKAYNYRNGMIGFFNQNPQIGNSKIYKNDNLKMLEDQEFENLIISRMIYNEDLIANYNKLNEILTLTLELLTNK